MVVMVMVVMVMVVMKLVDNFVFMGPKSDHCLALSDTESVTVSPLVDFCSNLIYQSCYMDFIKLLDKSFKIDVLIFLIFYIHLSKLIYGFL